MHKYLFRTNNGSNVFEPIFKIQITDFQGILQAVYHNRKCSVLVPNLFFLRLLCQNIYLRQANDRSQSSSTNFLHFIMEPFGIPTFLFITMWYWANFVAKFSPYFLAYKSQFWPNMMKIWQFRLEFFDSVYQTFIQV